MKSHKIIEHTAGSKKLHRKNLRGGFTQRVLHVVSLIPLGKTMTYAQVAEHAGNPKAFRAVGNILNKNRDPFIPCHRVIRSDGKPGGYAFGGEAAKQKKLEQEKKLSCTRR